MRLDIFHSCSFSQRDIACFRCAGATGSTLCHWQQPGWSVQEGNTVLLSVLFAHRYKMTSRRLCSLGELTGWLAYVWSNSTRQLCSHVSPRNVQGCSACVKTVSVTSITQLSKHAILAERTIRRHWTEVRVTAVSHPSAVSWTMAHFLLLLLSFPVCRLVFIFHALYRLFHCANNQSTCMAVFVCSAVAATNLT